MVGSFLCDAILRCTSEAGLVVPNLTLLVRKRGRSNLLTFGSRKNVTIVETSLNSWKTDKEFDFCIHAASPASPTKYYDWSEVSEANVDFIESLSRGKLPAVFLYVSSGEVYGTNTPHGFTEDFMGEPPPESIRSIYPEAKLKAERLILQLGEEGRTRPVITRLFHSYGPGLGRNDGRSFADFLWSGASGNNITLRSRGDDIRTFLYLEDSVAGILNCLTLGAAKEIYNVGSDLPYRVVDFANAVGEMSGVNVMTLSDKESEGDKYIHSPNDSIIPSNAKLRGLGWAQKVTLGEGIRRSVAWIKSSLTQAAEG